jgi:hypothetical protein
MQGVIRRTMREEKRRKMRCRGNRREEMKISREVYDRDGEKEK